MTWDYEMVLVGDMWIELCEARIAGLYATPFSEAPPHKYRTFNGRELDDGMGPLHFSCRSSTIVILDDCLDDCDVVIPPMSLL